VHHDTYVQPQPGWPGGRGPDACAASSSPQAQQEEQQQEQNGGLASTQACCTSNAHVTVPSAIAPVSSGTLIIGTICGSPPRPAMG